MKKKSICLILVLIILIVGIIIYCKLSPNVNSNINNIEHIISIRTNDKKIEAFTGSFCYNNGLCVDKVDFQDVDYDIITSYYDNKLYIDNLEGNIDSIELFNYGTKEFIDTKVYYSNKYIVTPSISGIYIFKISAFYQNKKIEYYFMSNISKISGEDINVKIELKENTLTSKGLTMIINNLSDKDLEYGNPYTIEKYEDDIWKTVKPANEISYTLPVYILKQNDSVELSINWEYGYGELKGKYRIVKEFDFNENDNYISFNKYLEFEIK